MAYVGCKWCGGQGCVCCPQQREIDQKRFKQEIPQPIFSADPNNPKDMERMRRVCGAEALEKAFGPDGGGIQEVEFNAAVQSLLQVLDKDNEQADTDKEAGHE